MKKTIKGETVIDIDAVGLCNAICETARSFYYATENKELFCDRYINNINWIRKFVTMSVFAIISCETFITDYRDSLKLFGWQYKERKF